MALRPGDTVYWGDQPALVQTAEGDAVALRVGDRNLLVSATDPNFHYGICPTCGQWQNATSGDCTHECAQRGFTKRAIAALPAVHGGRLVHDRADENGVVIRRWLFELPPLPRGRRSSLSRYVVVSLAQLSRRDRGSPDEYVVFPARANGQIAVYQELASYQANYFAANIPLSERIVAVMAKAGYDARGLLTTKTTGEATRRSYQPLFTGDDDE